jgi:hypothetical protein
MGDGPTGDGRFRVHAVLPTATEAGPAWADTPVKDEKSDLPVRVLHAVTGFNEVEAALSRTSGLVNGLRSCAGVPREERA